LPRRPRGRAALSAEGLRIGLCEHEVRLTIESAFRAGRDGPSKLAALRSERMALFERKFVD
jgi:hypothetical protein